MLILTGRFLNDVNNNNTSFWNFTRLVIEQDTLFCTFYCSCKKWRADGLQSSERHVYADTEFRIIIDILLCLHYWEPSITAQCFCQLGFFEKTKNLSLLDNLYRIHYVFTDININPSPWEDASFQICYTTMVTLRLKSNTFVRNWIYNKH